MPGHGSLCRAGHLPGTLLDLGFSPSRCRSQLPGQAAEINQRPPLVAAAVTNSRGSGGKHPAGPGNPCQGVPKTHIQARRQWHSPGVQEEPVSAGKPSTQNPARPLSGVAARPSGITFPAEQKPAANVEVSSMHRTTPSGWAGNCVSTCAHLGGGAGGGQRQSLFHILDFLMFNPTSNQ